jgi:hypothetical protein
MGWTIEMGLVAIPSFIKIGSDIKKLIGWGIDSHTESIVIS